MGRKSRTKGQQYEIEVRDALRDLFNDPQRNLDQVREKEGRDLDGTQPLTVQCKRRKRVAMGTVMAGLQEAIESCDNEYTTPCVVFRSDFGVSHITFVLDDFVALLYDYMNGGYE